MRLRSFCNIPLPCHTRLWKPPWIAQHLHLLSVPSIFHVQLYMEKSNTVCVKTTGVYCIKQNWRLLTHLIKHLKVLTIAVSYQGEYLIALRYLIKYIVPSSCAKTYHISNQTHRILFWKSILMLTSVIPTTI